jgi:hypothetical protein
MSLGLILEIYFIWSVLLAATGLVLINLSIDIGRLLKRTWKNSEQVVAHETKSKKIFSIRINRVLNMYHLSMRQ